MRRGRAGRRGCGAAGRLPSCGFSTRRQCKKLVVQAARLNNYACGGYSIIRSVLKQPDLLKRCGGHPLATKSLGAISSRSERCGGILCHIALVASLSASDGSHRPALRRHPDRRATRQRLAQLLSCTAPSTPLPPQVAGVVQNAQYAEDCAKHYCGEPWGPIAAKQTCARVALDRGETRKAHDNVVSAYNGFLNAIREEGGWVAPLIRTLTFEARVIAERADSEVSKRAKAAVPVSRNRMKL